MRSTSLPPRSRPARIPELRAPAALIAGAGLAAAAGWLSAQRSPLVTGGAILGAALGGLALRRALVAVALLLAVVALLPFGVVPLRLGVAPTLLDLATAAVLAVWIARAAAQRAPARLTGVGAALALFAAALVVAYVFSPERLAPDETARTFVKLVVAHLMLIPTVNLATRQADVRRTVTLLVAVASLEALVGLALYAVPRHVAYRALASLGPLGYPTGDAVLRYRPDTEILRATGTAVDPNMLGALLMVAGAIAATLLAAPKPPLPRAWLAAALGPVALCLLLTESRGAWLGLVGGLLLVTGLVYRRVWLAAAVCALLALLTPAAQRFTGHLLSGLQAQDRAASMRLGEIDNALRVIARHPLYGAGWGEGGGSVDLEFTLGVSNVFLTVGQRSGLPALALYVGCWLTLAALLWPALRARLHARTPSEDDGVLVGLCAALMGAAIAGMVDHHFVRFPHLVTLLWVVAGLALVSARERAA